MAKAGEAAKARAEKRSNVKQKKKFENKNSIGKTRRKVGSEARYMTRTAAVKKLQVTLKDFRRLCILKGIYPREPKKKFKGGNTTYYFAKDIAFLAHEPLLHKFREQKAFLKKIRRAVGRHEKKEARRLDARRPVYKLDHLVRERYPSFADALQDLDDALSLVHLFAMVAPSKLVPPVRVHACAALAAQWQAYVARTRSLRKVFVSIKGFYYQADVQGVTLTWVVPHEFAQQTTANVDYRVMLSFLELYEALMTLTNYKLYHDAALAYPPPIDDTTDAKGGRLSAMLMLPSAGPMRTPGAAPPLAPPPTALSAPGGGGGAAARGAKPPSAEQLAALRKKLSRVDTDGAADAAAEEEAAEEAEEAAAAGGDGEQEDLDAEMAPEIKALRQLFGSCVLYCGRECPLRSLEFVVLACGGTLGWDGEASRLEGSDGSITHQIVDRPMAEEDMLPKTREIVQPQWVYDCINARALLPTAPYRPGRLCPPHLSPFLDGDEGYTPLERVRAALTASGGAGEAAGEGGGGEDCSEGGGEESDEESEGEAGSEGEEEGEGEGEEEDEDEGEGEEDTELAEQRIEAMHKEGGTQAVAALLQEQGDKAPSKSSKGKAHASGTRGCQAEARDGKGAGQRRRSAENASPQRVLRSASKPVDLDNDESDGDGGGGEDPAPKKGGAKKRPAKSKAPKAPPKKPRAAATRKAPIDVVYLEHPKIAGCYAAVVAKGVSFEAIQQEFKSALELSVDKVQYHVNGTRHVACDSAGLELIFAAAAKEGKTSCTLRPFDVAATLKQSGADEGSVRPPFTEASPRPLGGGVASSSALVLHEPEGTPAWLGAAEGELARVPYGDPSASCGRIAADPPAAEPID